MTDSIVDWAAKQIQSHSSVEEIDLISPNFFTIRRAKLPPTNVYLLPNRGPISGEIISTAVSGGTDIEFICNIPKDGYWTGEAIELVREHSWGWGGLGDLYSALTQQCLKNFQKKEYSFVENGLIQHNRVHKLERIYDRVFLVHIYDANPVRINLIYSYEMTVDQVRESINNYGQCNFILRTNPNGGPTKQAWDAATKLKIPILTWGELFGQLNNC